MSGAVLIDSPSTILADTIRSGRIVFLINRTGKLRQRFCALATSCGILFETAEELTRHLNTFSLDALCKKQEYYREIFLRDYCGDVPSYGIFDVIDSWMRSLQYDSRIMSFVTKS